MAYQSLYRRYRPQRFADVRGQDHATRALRNSVRDGRVAHAYLFSGPRGTGKTSTARILAKALNCAAPQDGEPCGTCDSCVQIAAGASLDVHELDAASNNGVEAMRELVARTALGTPGRWKVYIVDEVHMLSAAASNALLKTLEEPPAHVVFVLATTDPHKVLPTIRSRTQHFEFRLLPPDLLVEHLTWVAADAGLDVPSEAIELVARRGNGSARDALSALDQVAAAGGVEDERVAVEDLVEALAERDAGQALAAVAEASAAGRDPRQLARDLVERLREVFLALFNRDLVGLSDADLIRAEEQARRMGAPAAVRAIEVLGEALVDMRDSADPRITLEVALVRLARPDADASPGALLERLERLERRLEGSPAPAAATPVPDPQASGPATRPAGSARAALGAFRAKEAPPAAPAAPPEATDPAGAGPAAQAGLPPTRDELVLAWGDELLGRLPGSARALFKAGRFLDGADGAAVFALPNAVHRDRCEKRRPEVEDVLSAHFGRTVRLQLVVDPGSSAPAGAGDDSIELSDEPVKAAPGIEHLTRAFPGAELVEE